VLGTRGFSQGGGSSAAKGDGIRRTASADRLEPGQYCPLFDYSDVRALI